MHQLWDLPVGSWLTSDEVIRYLEPWILHQTVLNHSLPQTQACSMHGAVESKPDSLSLFPRSSYFASSYVTGDRIIPHRCIHKISCKKCKQDNHDKEKWRRINNFREECLDLPDQITFELRSGGTSGKEPAGQCRWYKRCGFDPWVEKIPWRRAWQPTPVFLPGESHGQRNLAGYGPQIRRVGHDWNHLERIRQLHFPYSRVDM